MFIDALLISFCVAVLCVGKLQSRFVYNSTMFLVGYLSASHGLYKRAEFINEWLALFLILLIYPLKWLMIFRGGAHNALDILLVPVFVYLLICVRNGLFEKFENAHVFKQLIKVLSDNSLIVWLTHTFFIYYYFQDMMLNLKYGVIIYIMAFVFCLLIAFPIKLFTKQIMNFIR